MTQAFHTPLVEVISARKGGSLLAMTQAVDIPENGDHRERTAVEAHFHQWTSF